MYSDFDRSSIHSSGPTVDRLNETYRRSVSASAHRSASSQGTRSQTSSSDVLSADGSWTEVIMLLVLMFGLLITSSVALGLAIGRVTIVTQHITELASQQRAHDLGLAADEKP